MRRYSFLAAISTLVIVVSCGEPTSAPSATAVRATTSPLSSLDIQTEYLCGATISPSSQSVQQGTTAYISTTLPVCSRATGLLTRYDHTTGYWHASDGTTVYDQYGRYASNNATDQAHLTPQSLGTVTVTVRPCCDINYAQVTLTSTIQVTPRPLAVVMYGETSVYNSSDCNITYTTSVTGGTPPYSYQWSTSGVIKQNNGGFIVAAFPTEGYHSVSVTVTDAAGVTQNDGMGVYASPSGLVCAY